MNNLKSKPLWGKLGVSMKKTLEPTKGNYPNPLQSLRRHDSDMLHPVINRNQRGIERQESVKKAVRAEGDRHQPWRQQASVSARLDRLLSIKKNFLPPKKKIFD